MPLDHDLIFYDGQCGLCHWLVKFTVKRDREGKFCFAPLQGRTIRQLMDERARLALPDSVVVRTTAGRVLMKSAAVIYILGRLGGVYACAAFAGRLLPTRVAEWGYDRIAASRGRLFAKPQEACPLVPPGLRGRLLP